MFVGKKKLKKGLNLGPLHWREDSNHYITFFSLKLLCKKYTYNINHYASIVKTIPCWAFYSKCIEPNATFNLLLLFSVCQLAYPFPNKEAWKRVFSYLCLHTLFTNLHLIFHLLNFNPIVESNWFNSNKLNWISIEFQFNSSCKQCHSIFSFKWKLVFF